MNDWLPRCADLVDSMMNHWKHLVPMKSKDGGRAAILFRCIHSLMSRQVQGLIKRSIDHFYNALIVYKVNLCSRTAEQFCCCISIFRLKPSPILYIYIFERPLVYFPLKDEEKENTGICHLLTVQRMIYLMLLCAFCLSLSVSLFSGARWKID